VALNANYGIPQGKKKEGRAAAHAKGAKKNALKVLKLKLFRAKKP